MRLYIIDVLWVKLLSIFIPSAVEAFSAVKPPSSSSSASALPTDLLSQIRQAMTLTTSSDHNITTARRAVRLWDDILGNDIEDGPDAGSNRQAKIPPAIQAASLALHASVLTRIGNDKRAVRVYSSVLAPTLQSYLTPESMRDVCFGRGSALQRLMRYEEARDQFVDYLNYVILNQQKSKYGTRSKAADDAGMMMNIAKAAYNAATCALRLQDYNGAMKILDTYANRVGRTKIEKWGGNVAGLYGFTRYVQGNDTDTSPDALRLLEHAAKTSATPVYRWLYYLATGDLDSISDEDFSFLDLAAVNQSPLDDPRLINLDDKVLLHQLMTSNCDNPGFWPDGFILPDETDKFKKYAEVQDGAGWILKDRAGYGSHGNQVLPSGKDALSYINNSPEDDQTLCQRIVGPPLLIDGRKFSLRVYVIYFESADDTDIQAYISTEGLAKFASSPYADKDIDWDNDDVFMTNSGLGEGDDATQLDVQQLRQEFQRQGWDYDKLWRDISDIAQSTMRHYRKNCQSRERSGGECSNPSKVLHMRAQLPKVMGLDFLVDKNKKSWLIEVNRFPGLEPRGPSDEIVKSKVVEDAWYVACRLADVPPKVVGMKGKRVGKSSLVEIDLDT